MTLWAGMLRDSLSPSSPNGSEHKLANTYYDAQEVFYKVYDYTGDSQWLTAAGYAQSAYATYYVDANSGGVPGYWSFTHGLTRDYILNADTAARNSVNLLRTNAAFHTTGDTSDDLLSRENAYALIAHINAVRCGYSANTSRITTLFNNALGHIDQWCVSLTADYVRPFMVALTCRALIHYWQYYNEDSQIPTAIATAYDYIHTNCWDAAAKSWNYTDRDVGSTDPVDLDPQPDLNMLILPVLGWLYSNPTVTDSKWLTRGDEAFDGGVSIYDQYGFWVSGAYLGGQSAASVNGKHVCQYLVWSTDYLSWRGFVPVTNYVSASAGAWTTTTNWTPNGTPGNNDTVTISHAMTLNANTTIGTSGVAGTAAITINAGSLTVADGVTLTVRGDTVLNNSTLTFGAGSGYEFDASAAASPSTTKYQLIIGTGHNQNNAKLVINGTSGSRSFVRSNSGGANGWINDGSGPWLGGAKMECVFTDFLRVGDATNDAIRTSPTGSYVFSLTDCTFDACGKIGGTYNLGATCTYILRRCNFKNGAHATDSLTIFNASGYTSGTRTLDDCVFDKQVHGYQFLGFVVDDNLFCETVDCTVGAWLSADGNMFLKNDNALPGSLSNSYFLYDGATDNPHFMQPNPAGDCTYTGLIFEAPDAVNTSDCGDCISMVSPGSVMTFTIQNCLVLPAAGGRTSGTLFSALGNANVRIAANHNTWYLTANDPTARFPAMGVVGETFNTNAGQVTSFKSNLACSNSARNAYMYDNINGSPNTDTVTAANANYNNMYNLAAGSAGKGYDAPFTGSPGANDLNVNPNFVDPTRNAAKWDLSIGGAGTEANAIVELKKRNATGYNSNYTIANLVAYVRDGFKPTNVLLRNAGHDGVTIGALEGSFSTMVSSSPRSMRGVGA